MEENKKAAAGIFVHGIAGMDKRFVKILRLTVRELIKDCENKKIQKVVIIGLDSDVEHINIANLCNLEYKTFKGLKDAFQHMYTSYYAPYTHYVIAVDKKNEHRYNSNIATFLSEKLFQYGRVTRIDITDVGPGTILKHSNGQRYLVLSVFKEKRSAQEYINIINLNFVCESKIITRHRLFEYKVIGQEDISILYALNNKYY